jgi:hypothetical protein
LALEPNCQNTGVKEGTNHDQSIDMDLKPGFKKKNFLSHVFEDISAVSR